MSVMINSTSISNIQDNLDMSIPEMNPAHLFCENRSEINTPNEYGWTPLYRSLVSNNIKAARELLKLGADPNITNNMGETPLYQAVDMGSIEAVKLLLQTNIDPNIAKSDGNTPLHLAVKKMNTEIIEILLSKGANSNLQNRLYQQTPLHFAIKNKCDIQLIQLFKQTGANFDIKDKYDKTPIDYCDDETYVNSMKNIMIDKNEIIVEDNSVLADVSNNIQMQRVITSEAERSEEGESELNKKILNDKDNEVNYDLSINNTFNKNKEDNNKFIPKTEVEELIKKKSVSDMSSNKIHSPNHIITLSENSNLLKNKIDTKTPKTIQEIYSRPKTSNFNLSTPRDDIKNIDGSQKGEILLTLENGSFLSLNSKKNSSNPSVNHKNDISEINPLDLVNQVVTTNSNIFSELHTQNDQNDSKTHIKTETDNKIEVFSDIQKKDIMNENYNNNGLNDSLEDRDLTYSKSKSYIVSELPMTSFKKSNTNTSHSFLTNNKEGEDEKEGELSDNKNSYIQRPSIGNKISYHKNAKEIKNENNENNINELNIINIPQNLSKTRNTMKTFEDFCHESYDKKSSKTTTKILQLNKNYIELNSSNTNNLTDLEFNNSNNSNKEQTNKNSSRIYSSNSTRNNTTTLYNLNTNKGLNTSNLNNNNYKYKYNTNSQYDTSTMSQTASYNTNSKKKGNSIINDYAFKNSQFIPTTNETYTVTNVNNCDYRSQITSDESKRLHEWLLSADLLTYYNLLLEQGIYAIDKCIEGIKNGELNLTYKDIEDLGFRKPGHIYRFLLKLQCDANLIDYRIINYLLPNKFSGDRLARHSRFSIQIVNDAECWGCGFKEEKNINQLDIDYWLRSKGLINLRENFIHNGFDIVEFLIMQLFSIYPIDDDLLIENLHIYNESDRKKLLKVLDGEKRKICDKLSISYIDLEREESNFDERGEKCKICAIF